MKIAIHQPQYLPWLGYFDKIDQADVFVLLDDVQYKKNEWQNRNKIRNADGEQWLTVPVLHDFGQLINEIKINDRESWRAKHIKSLEQNYSKAPFFENYFRSFCDIFMVDWEYLSRLNICLIMYFKDALAINTDMIRSSALDVKYSSTERLVEICRRLKADTYISGAGGREYLEEGKFSDSGIKVEYQEYKHPEYEQVFRGFSPYMSVIDLLLCKGPESLDIIRSGRSIS
jgi:hypothetical protein